jgi:hypothetical protein
VRLSGLSELVWKKPVICIFKERDINPEIDPFVVVKAKKITLTPKEGSKYQGNLADFFTLMGDADYLSSVKGKADHYVMCWFDDTEPDVTKDLRRLRGVTFNGKVTCMMNEKTGKRTYNASFMAEHAKLK